MRTTALCILVLFATGAGWLDRWHQARTGNRLYDEGKYEAATQAYNQGLVEDPDSTVLHFNLGAAQYKQSQYEAALKALQQVPMSDDSPERTARVAYNAGNTAYKMGTMSEGSQPQKALEAWAQSLAFYRRALGVRPDDADAKFNYEFVTKRIVDLKQKLEEQKRKDQEQKDQQQKDQQQEQKPDDKPDPQGQDQKQEEKPDQDQDPGKDQAKDQPQQPEGGSPADQPPPEGQGGESDSDVAGEKKDGEMSKKEAVAVLDGERDEEVQPDEVVKRLQGAKVGRPAKDW